jgi:hypothetical protein
MRSNDNEYISTKRSRFSEKIEESKMNTAIVEDIDDDFSALGVSSDFKVGCC